MGLKSLIQKQAKIAFDLIGNADNDGLQHTVGWYRPSTTQTYNYDTRRMEGSAFTIYIGKGLPSKYNAEEQVQGKRREASIKVLFYFPDVNPDQALTTREPREDDYMEFYGRRWSVLDWEIDTSETTLTVYLKETPWQAGV